MHTSAIADLRWLAQKGEHLRMTVHELLHGSLETV